jgi:hypothetical protein
MGKICFCLLLLMKRRDGGRLTFQVEVQVEFIIANETQQKIECIFIEFILIVRICCNAMFNVHYTRSKYLI